MTVREVIDGRGIVEVQHVTTNTGLLGMLASGSILSRQRLPEEKYIEHVYEPNAQVRKDKAWLDYVNLSMSKINTEFFGHAERWHAHRDIWWCVLALDPTILEHDGVVFATTNNIYTGVTRGTGGEGLEALFADRVVRWHGNVATRPESKPNELTTCHQAEVLYPEQVDISWLRRVYVATPEHADIVGAQIEVLASGSSAQGGAAEADRLPIDADQQAGLIVVRPEVFV